MWVYLFIYFTIVRDFSLYPSKYLCLENNPTLEIHLKSKVFPALLKQGVTISKMLSYYFTIKSV